MNDSAEKKILTKLTHAGQGISLKVLQRDMREIETKVLSDAIRGLMESRKVTIHQVDGERYIAVVNNLAEGLAVVFDLIRASGSEGIDQTMICTKAKLPKTEVTKALNQLMAQQRIKDIRCFSNKAKKLFMLHELEPSETVTGGAFYNEMRDIDVPFVDGLRSRIVSFVGAKKVVSLSQILQLVEDTSSNKAISSREARQLVSTLEMDGILEVVPQHASDGCDLVQLAQGQNVTRYAMPQTMGAAVSQFPCVGCPLLQRCAAHGVGAVNPVSCTYLDDWLRLD